ncbi:MAG TPA: hypothetical protein VF549_02490 [Solirubrobacteraceae bacterium]|jgi:hypothetical protein
MRLRTTGALVVATFACALAAQPTMAADLKTLSKPSPLTAAQKQQIHDAGAAGVKFAAEELNLWCPGVQSRGVSANGCIVSPYGCTANFVFSDGRDWHTYAYVGTASHCSDKNGDRVIMQVDTTTLADVGYVVKQTAAEEPGNDFALIKIDPAVAKKWGVNPAIPTGGPQGIYTGCDPQVIKNYGHGYGVAVGQGKPEAGVATDWYQDGYGWFGPGLPGDSGSGITLADNRSAGDFTHIIIFDPALAFAPGELTGTRTTKILSFLGASYSQVNADGTLSRATSNPCPAMPR